MAVGSGTSLILASVISVLLFSAMQIYRPWLASSQVNTLLGGFLGSWLFILSLTAVNNLENVVMGKGFQARLFPEIIFCLIGAMVASGMVHRVCVTTCLIFSIVAIYFINKISQKEYNSSSIVADVHVSKKKKNK